MDIEIGEAHLTAPKRRSGYMVRKVPEAVIPAPPRRTEVAQGIGVVLGAWREITVVLDGPADLALLRLRPGVLGGRGWLAGKLLRRHPRLLSGLAGKLLTAHRLPALRLALELLPTHRLPALGLAAAHRLPRLALVLLPALLLHRN